MALLIRELMLDLAQNSIVHYNNRDYLLSRGVGIAWEYLQNWEQHCEFRCDIKDALHELYSTGQVDSTCILLLTKFVSGYTLAELKLEIPNAEELLVKTFALLEYTSGYTDGGFIRKVIEKYPKYANIAEDRHNAMHIAGRTFE